MRKTIKRLGAVLLAMAMAVSVLCTGALAADTYSITVTNTTAGYTYQAYQIFAGTLGDKDTNKTETPLGITDWGSGLKGNESKLITDLKADQTIGSLFSDVLAHGDTILDASNAIVAQNVAAVISKDTFTSEHAKVFAKIVGNNVNTAVAGTANTVTGEGDNAGYHIGLKDAGYYLVKNSAIPTGNEAYTNYILKVVGNEKVENKSSVPTVDKKVKNSANTDETDATGTTASIGDTVTFTLTGTLPDKYADYNTYKYVFHDTLDAGLTLKSDSITVYENSIDEANKIDTGKYTVKTSGLTDNCTFEVAFEDLKKSRLALDKSSKIIVVYSATVNENAIIGTDGNKNTVKLEYSNDPNWGGGENEPTGNTPESYVKVYSTGLKLQKIDGQTKAALTGAKFTIEGTTHQIGYTYRPSDSGTYYKQADGRYSTTVPENSENATKYERIASTAEQQKFTATAEVGSDGTLVIRGLGAGTYTITEIVAPTGYNLLKDPITITIAGTATNDGVTWTVKKDSESLSPDIKDNHLYLLQVQNNKGSTLPSTGGMGTKLFYTIGGILMAGAAIVLVVRKRRSDAE